MNYVCQLRKLLIVLCCCAVIVPALAQTGVEPGRPVVTVIALDGDVEFRRADWNAVNQTLSVGAQLTGQDLVFAEGGQIEVLCPDGSRRVFDELLARDVLNCPASSSIIGSPGERRVAYQRGGVQRRDVPYLISPRSTLVTTETVTLRWNHVPGAETYRLRVLEDTQTIWSSGELDAEDVVTGRVGQVTPDFTLMEESAYTVLVCATTGITEVCTNDEGNATSVNLSFSYRPLDAEREEALANIARDFGADTPEALYAQALVLAQPVDTSDDQMPAYYADAIVLLEQIAADYSESRLVNSAEYHNQLGELYRRVSLPQSARASFERAQPIASPDTESYANAVLGLAFVADVDEADDLLDTALDIYAGFLSEEAFVEFRREACAALEACE